MKSPVIPLLSLGASLFVSACAPLPREVAFNEAAFSPYHGTGSATIVGTAYTVLRNKDTRTATENATIKLVPDNAYTEEVATKRFQANRKLEPADPRYEKYVRRVHPDNDGHFAFRHLPAGKYIVAAHLHWSSTVVNTNDDGTTYDSDVPVDQWIYSRVAVKSGETVKVDDWNQGR